MGMSAIVDFRGDSRQIFAFQGPFLQNSDEKRILVRCWKLCFWTWLPGIDEFSLVSVRLTRSSDILNFKELKAAAATLGWLLSSCCSPWCQLGYLERYEKAYRAIAVASHFSACNG